MRGSNTIRRMGWTRVLLVVIAGSMIIAACTSDDSSADMSAAETTTVPASYEEVSGDALAGEDDGEGTVAGSYDVVLEDGTVVFQQTQVATYDAKIIRDGTIDLRIEPGTFGTSSSQLRQIATDLGGYVASGESRIEEFDDDRYAVGWFTLRVPSERFEEAVDRVEVLGERVSASLTSQDVTEEYVDLQGRLRYWREQEAFYSRLMEEATTIDDLVTLQTRMQDVLLNIEQIEGRLRYLESRTAFGTLTVGLTEVPTTAPPPPPVEEPAEPGPIAEAFDQAGQVLLATVSFLIVAAAVAIPLGILAIFGWIGYRLVNRNTKQEVTET